MKNEKNKEYAEAKFKRMTEQLRFLNSDKQVAEYLQWIARYDIAKEYWTKEIINKP